MHIVALMHQNLNRMQHYAHNMQPYPTVQYNYIIWHNYIQLYNIIDSLTNGIHLQQYVYRAI